MLPIDHLLAFVLIAFVLILVPGPSVLFVVTRSLTLGRGAGVATVVGNTAGVYVQVTAVALGLGALVQESIAVFQIVKWCGAAYLVFLGLLNPKVIVFFMAVLPQFVERSGSVTMQLLTLGAIFCAIALLCDSMWVLLAGSARGRLVSSPRRLAAIGGTGGLVLAGLGAGLAASGRPKASRVPPSGR